MKIKLYYPIMKKIDYDNITDDHLKNFLKRIIKDISDSFFQKLIYLSCIIGLVIVVYSISFYHKMQPKEMAF